MDHFASHSWEYLLPQTGERWTGYWFDGGHSATIYFIHGNGLSSMTYWRYLQPFLAHYNLMTVDVQGHGNTEARREFIGWESCARECLNIYKKKCEKYLEDPNHIHIAMGHSFGGILCTMMENFQETSTFKRLILLDPVLFAPVFLYPMRILKFIGLHRQFSLARAARQRRQHWPTLQEIRDSFQSKALFKSWDTTSFEDYIRHNFGKIDEGWELKCPPRIESAIFANPPMSLWNFVKQIKSPTTIIFGHQTYWWLPPMIKRAERINLNITALVSKGSHFFLLESPTQTAQFVLTCLASDLKT